MTAKTPIRTVFDGSNNATGLAEFQSGEFIGLTHGGLGASLSIGTAGQVLKVNSGATALEFGNAVAVVDIDGATDLTGATLVAGDQILISDGGTEGRVTLSQIDTLFTSTTQTLTNKTIDTANNTITIVEADISDLGSYITASSTDTLTNKTLGATTIAGHLIPDANITYDLGSSTFRFRDLYLSGTSIELGSATITASGSSVILPAGSTISGGDGEVVDLNSTQTLTNKTISDANNTLTINSANSTITIDGTEATLSNIGNSSLTNSSITVTDGTTSTATSLGGTITFSGTANEVEVGESSGTITIGLPNDVTIGNDLTVSGNLTVSGTTTTVNTETINLADNTITLNSNETGTPSQDGGIEIERGTSTNKTLIWNETTDKWTVGSETFVAGTFEGNLTGNVTGDVTGNADTATTLETARSIAGQSFDGSADITIASTDLSNTSNITLNDATQTLTNKTISGSSNTLSNIANSSLTNSSITFAGDSGSDSASLGETVTIAGGTNITTAATSNTITINLDSNVVTETSTDTLTNKTINTASNTITIVEADISDLQSYILADSTDTLTNKTISGASNTLSNIGNSSLSNSSITVAGDSGSDGVSLGETLTIAGGTGLTSTGSSNTITIALDNTTVTSGSYGSSTAIPTFTVDAQGRLTAASTTAISSDMSIAGDTGTDTITVGTDTFTIAGGTGLTSTATTDTITLNIDSTVVTLTDTQTLINKTLTSPDINAGTIDGATINGGTIGASTAVTELQVDNININGNSITSTNTNGNLSLSPDGSGTIDVNSAKITSLGTPTVGTDAATKAYVDTIAAAGIHYHDPVRVESPTNLNATYDNGTAGVGATLTNAGTQVALSIDGVTLSLNDRVLIYTQTNAAHNGIYYVSDTGSGASNWELTRTTDTDSYGASDPDAFGQGDAFFVKEGDTGAGELYVMNTEGTITFGTTNITFTQVAETAVYSAGAAGALTLTGTAFSANVDDSTIEISSNALQVKDSGITASQLATNSVTTAKITDANVTAAKLAATLDLSGKTITLPSSFTTNTDSQTLTNKTISGSSNTLSNIGNSSLTNSSITVAGDSGSDGVNLGQTLTIAGGTNITTAATSNTITIALDNTAVTPGSYGSSTAIPTFTVDAQGRLTAASTTAISSVAVTADYNDLINTPAPFDPATLATVATTGSFNDLSDKPAPFDPSTLATVATTGSYNDLSDTPNLGTWTITESGGSLYFADGGVTKMKLDQSGNLQVVGNIESNATIS